MNMQFDEDAWLEMLKEVREQTVELRQRWKGLSASALRRGPKSSREVRQAICGFEQAGIQAFQRRVKRQHHEGQESVDQAEDYRAVVVQQRQRLADESE